MRVRLTGLVTALVTAAVGLVLVAAGAQAQAPERPAAQGGDDTISIRGKLVDTRETPPAPVEGVRISVSDEEGEVVGEDESDAKGQFDIPLPGETIDILGQTYTVHLDEDTLPKGTALRDPEQVNLKVTINLEADKVVAFPIGEGSSGETSKFTQALQLAVGGIVFSVLLAMAALGLSMIFGTTGLTNFSHGELITFGALAAFAIDKLPGEISIGGADITVIVAVVGAFVLSALFGWLNDAALWKPLRRRGTGIIAMMIVSIGLSIFLRNLFQYLFGADTHNYSQFASPQPWDLGPVLVTPKDVIVVAISVAVLLAVTQALQRTRLGKATRAVADNPALAASSGINVDRVISAVWIGGAALAGLSGVLLGLTQGFDYQIGFKILLLVFAAVVLGGLGTIWGAILGAFIIGIFIELSTLWVPSELKFVGALAVLIVVLLFRPQGLLGRAERIG